MGALVLELDDGKQIRVGSGLKDVDRKTPPKVGERVKFSYEGLTAYGVPRFPRFIGTRADA